MHERIELGQEVHDVKIDSRQDIAALPFSSGTTGLSKGVMLTHYNIIANTCQLKFRGFDPVVADDVSLLVLPLFHIYGLVVIGLNGLRTGNTILVMSAFEPNHFLDSVQRYRVTFMYVAPPIVVFLTKFPGVDQYDFSSLRGMLTGAAPIGEETIKACMKRLKLGMFVQGYGMTELSPVSHCIFAWTEKYQSVARLVPNTECLIADAESKRSCGPNELGEIWIRGPQVMKGYINNPEATAATIDENGFLHTGDVGYYDQDGDYYVVDRLKELIKVKGFQVPPAELEALILTHPKVKDCAVVPFPDEESGEIPRAFVVVKPGEILLEQEIIQYVSERVSVHKRVKMISFIQEIPKSPSGKILRRLLKDIKP